jgi:hypothetical protein
MADETFTPYSTGQSLFGAPPTWVSDTLEQARLQAYSLYERMYWNVPDTFRLVQRGTNNAPVYVPSARTLVDTINRYVAPAYALNVHDRVEGPNGDSNDAIAARLALEDLMKRERFGAKFSGAKRFCQIQGDWVWHVTADPAKPVGSRISINSLDPSMYFPQFDPDNIERVVAVFLAQPGTRGDDTVVRRICYRKVPGADGVATITVEEGLFATDTWEDLEASPVEVIRAPEALPPEITAIPVYHTKGFEEPGNPFGSSEIRGLEGLMAAVNQTISDEDLAIALDGIGMYATTAPSPVDPVTKTPTAWQLGPGRVVHHPEGTDWARVNGVGSVAPFGDHYDRLWTGMKQAAATPDVAVGTVDVSIAESGIALALQLSPIIAKATEKDQLIIATHDQMWFDILNGWYPAYEQTIFNEVQVDSLVGSAVPINRAARFTELNDMLDRGVIDAQYYRDEAEKLGYVFPDDIGVRAAAEAAAKDTFANRVNTELNNGGGGE